MTKILLVEDDKSLREIYGVRLLAEGYDIISAGDGEEALAMAIKDRPNLILSDVMMPKISGFDMLDILRSTTETRDIKVIMMTALSSEEQRQRGVSLGADRYLVKSQVGIEDVVRTVHEVLADAPVTGQTPLVSPAPTSPTAPVTPTPITAPSPAIPPTPAPVSAPVIPTSAPIGTAPTPASPTTPAVSDSTSAATPGSAPTALSPAPTEPTPSTGSTSLPQSVLPEPSAPFSTPRPTNLAGRVIQPLESASNPGPDFGNMIDKELGGEAPAGTASPTPELAFEETPHPAAQNPTSAAAPNPLPPLPPLPPAPKTGV